MEAFKLFVFALYSLIISNKIFSCFDENSIGIVNGDQELLSNVSYNHPIARFGTKLTNQVQARKIKVANGKTSFILKLYSEKFSITFDHPHAGIVMNVLAASTLAYFLQVPNLAVVRGIQIPLSIPGRFEMRPIKRYQAQIVNDAYNANPESMKAALLAFNELKAQGKKIVVLGDMLELGINGPFWHRQIGRFLRKVGSVDQVVLVGSLVEWVQFAAPPSIDIVHVDSWQKAVEELKHMVTKESLVLVKGSNSMGLLNIVESLAQ